MLIKKLAFELFQKAANLKKVSGINSLGDCYYYGIGISIKYAKGLVREYIWNE